MKNLCKKDLLKEINQSSEELHQKVDRHRALMAAVLEERFNERTLKQLSLQYHSIGEGRLKEALKETIEVLEQSRKAFKSKRLEVLRKKLTQVLMDAE